MKKLFALLLALMLTCTIFVACSPEEEQPNNGNNGDNDSLLSEGSDPAASDREWGEGLLS